MSDVPVPMLVHLLLIVQVVSWLAVSQQAACMRLKGPQYV